MFKWFHKAMSRKHVVNRPRLLADELEERILLAASPLIDKSVSMTSAAGTLGDSVTIGEIVTYELIVTIEEGVTNNVMVTDDVPDGMSYLPGTLIVVPDGSPPGHIASTYVDEATSSSYDGDILTIDLGTIVNVFDGNAANDTIIITYEVVVENVLGNQDGVTRTNTATVTDGSSTDSAIYDVDIVEPVLTMSKEVIGTPSAVAPGDLLQYQIVISHTLLSRSDAYDLILSDDLPDQIEGTWIVSATLSDGIQPDVDVSSSLGIDVAGDLVTTGDIDLLVDAGAGVAQSLTIIIAGTVSGTAVELSLVGNEAIVTWTSLDGVDVGERDGIGGVDDYTASGIASFVVAAEDRYVPLTEPESHPAELPYQYDLVRNHAEKDIEDIFRFPVTELEYVLPPMPVSPLYSGSASPGSTLTITLFDDHGDVLGSQSVMADAGGNWLMIFSAVYLVDYPYTIEVHHEGVSQLSGASSDIDPLLYYSPAMNIITVFRNTIDEELVFTEAAGASIDLLRLSDGNPLSVTSFISN